MVPFRTLNIRCRIIIGIQKGIMILTTTPMAPVSTDTATYTNTYTEALGCRVWGLGFGLHMHMLYMHT